VREAPGLRFLGFHFFLRFLAALFFLAPEDLWLAEATFPCWPDSLAATCWPAGLEEADGIPLAISGMEMKVRIRIMAASFLIFLDFLGPARGLGPGRQCSRRRLQVVRTAGGFFRFYHYFRFSLAR